MKVLEGCRIREMVNGDREIQSSLTVVGLSYCQLDNRDRSTPVAQSRNFASAEDHPQTLIAERLEARLMGLEEQHEAQQLIGSMNDSFFGHSGRRQRSKGHTSPSIGIHILPISTSFNKFPLLDGFRFFPQCGGGWIALILRTRRNSIVSLTSTSFGAR